MAVGAAVTMEKMVVMSTTRKLKNRMVRVESSRRGNCCWRLGIPEKKARRRLEEGGSKKEARRRLEEGPKIGGGDSRSRGRGVPMYP